MPQRKQTPDILGAVLGGQPQPTLAGEQPTPSEAAPAEPVPMLHKTYLVTPEIARRLAELAKRERVGINELVRYLLTYGLDQVEGGAHKLPTETVVQEKRKIRG